LGDEIIFAFDTSGVSPQAALHAIGASRDPVDIRVSFSGIAC
jgi:hypothetical protein